ncbi:unnamed protein product, partial [Rotaria sp. Silwood2]
MCATNLLDLNKQRIRCVPICQADL